MEKVRFIRSAKLVILFPLLVFTACATGPEIPSVAELLGTTSDQDGGACLRVNEIRRYGVKGDEFIFINGTRGYYIATVNPDCPNLTPAPDIVFVGHLNKLCGNRMDKIFTGKSECTIRAIFEFENRDAAAAAYESATQQHSALIESSADRESN